MARSFLVPFLLSATIAVASAKDEGYAYGQAVPVTCLNRTIDTGEHIRDKQGNLQYIPFATCKETNAPLAIPFGVSDIVTCTIDPIPDELYHLFEYYIHGDAPLACRVPTGPLVPSIGSSAKSSDTGKNSDGNDDDDDKATDNSEYAIGDGSQGPSYTPLTIALQGTLQLSHVHLWTDINMIMHRVGADDIPDLPSAKTKKSKKGKSPGYVVAGTAYSLPELGGHLQHDGTNNKQGTQKLDKEGREKHATLVLEDARNPWTEGHGTKVVRGEPLKLTFRVSWVTGSERLGWTTTGSPFAPVDYGSSLIGAQGGFFSSLFFFVMAAGIGAVAALFYERVLASGSRGRYGGGRYWKGDGILGRPFQSTQAFSHVRNGSGVTYGSGGRANGYGGFTSQAENANSSSAWSSMSTGKKD